MNGQGNVRDALEYNSLLTDEWAVAFDRNDGVKAAKFTSTVLANGQLLTSAQYGRSRSRNGSRVLVQYENSIRALKYYACEAQFFVEISAAVGSDESGNGVPAPVRFAALTAWETEGPKHERLAELLLEATGGNYCHTMINLWWVPVSALLVPLHTHTPSSSCGTILRRGRLD